MSQPDEFPEDPYVPAEALPPPPPREKPMGFWDHLEELRSTLIKSAVAFVLCTALVGYFIKEFNHVLLWPLEQTKAQYPQLTLDLGLNSIMEVFNMIIQMCLLGGFTLALPFILFFIGQFVAPALTEREMRAVLPLCISAMILFLLGAAFSFFFLVPSTLKVSVELGTVFGMAFRWTAASYYSTLSWLTLGVGASFEFPLVIVLLVWMGLMTTEFLRKYRRHAIVVIFVIAAIITPTPDPVTQAFFAAPLYLLFELAVIVSARVEQRRILGRR